MTSTIDWPYPICMDGRMLDAQATGVGRYADTLLETFLQTGAKPMVLAADPRPAGLWRLVQAAQAGPRRALREPGGSRLVGPRALFKQAQLFFDLHGRLMPVCTDGPAGVMHWTYPVPLRMEGWRNLYTVHDAIPLKQPALTPINGRRHRRLLRVIVRSAERLLTVSETARADLIGELDCNARAVIAVPQGVAPLSAQGPASGLPPGGYYLFCGSVEPRKNLIRLAQAHAASGSTRPLVIAGPDGWRADEIMTEVAQTTHAVRLAYQTREGLGALVRDTRALLFPSLAEGFGLPVIEAMQMGAPVIASSLAALSETAGGAALLANPYDVEALTGAIRQIDQDDALVERLAKAGRERAAAFSLPAYAVRLAQVHAALPESRA